MSKSSGEFLTIETLIGKGYDPLAYRYLAFTAHYRRPLTFNEEALDGAQELEHRAESRETFATGALTAAKWVLDTPPGLYSMQDVLGLT